jgi:hypothetical protein
MIARWLTIAIFALVVVRSSDAGEQANKKSYPRSLDEMKQTLNVILVPDDGKADENSLALRRLQAYRYLAEVPYKDLKLDEGFNKMCLAGAKLCEKIGKLEHKPENPGLPEDEFKLAYMGTSRSNLGQGFKSLVQSVDAWMDDSDAGNIDRLGHRRWCLNPTMVKTGFGRSGIFTAMYSFDRSRTKPPDFDFICFPARGYMPIEFFGPHHAWSVSLNPKKYKTPAKDFVPKIYRADENGLKMGEPLKLIFSKVDTVPFGVPNCIIFRPEKLAPTRQAKFAVELEGIQPLGKKGTISLQYMVEFVKLK